MNIRNLKYFLEVAKDGNITKTAERLYISQQALSGHIRRLETYYQVSLFDRGPKGLTLTYAGRRLYITANELIAREHQIQEEMHDISHQIQGELRIGVPPMHGRMMLPKILPEYIEKNPHVSLRLQEASTPQLITKILQHELDILIGIGPITDPCLNVIPLTKENILFCVPQKYCHDDTASFESYLNLPLLLRNFGSPMRRTVDALLRRYNIVPNILLEMQSIDILMELCIQGVGATFYPEMFMPSGYQGNIRLFPLPEVMDSPFIVLAYRYDIYMSRAIRRFINLVSNKFSTDTTLQAPL